MSFVDKLISNKRLQQRQEVSCEVVNRTAPLPIPALPCGNHEAPSEPGPWPSGADMRRGGCWGANAFPISQASCSLGGLPQGEKKPHKRAGSGGPDPCLKGGCVRATVEGKSRPRAQAFREEHWELLECPGNPKRSRTRLATLQVPVPCH